MLRIFDTHLFDASNFSLSLCSSNYNLCTRTHTHTHTHTYPHPHTHTHTHHTTKPPPPHTHTHTHSLTEAGVCGKHERGAVGVEADVARGREQAASLGVEEKVGGRA